ncbi:MAG TPA: hypothetical protein VFV31_02820 [Chitinophagaceae bacterium]|nr:hypothetical protein [Chitinophagaceae bacterium]
MKFNHSIFFFLQFLIAFSATAQQGASIKSSVDKNRILIGEPLLLKVEAVFKKVSSGTLPVDSIPHFEQLEKPLIDSVITNDRITIRGIFKLTSFDSGHWVIPSFSLSKNVRTDTIPVDVVFSDFDPAQDYHDIKDILEAEPEKQKIAWWWYMAAALLAAGVLAIYFRKKKRPLPATTIKVSVNPYDDAMQQMSGLKNKKLSGKEFHTELTAIFRLYLYRKNGILSLQKTTDDLVVQLRDIGMGKEQFEKLSQSLRLGDFVKFAKFNPSVQENETCFEDIQKAIMHIEKTETKSFL